MSGVDRFTRQGVGASDRAGFWVHASDFNQKMTQAQDREAYLQDQIEKWTALHGEHFKRAEILKLERDALQQRLTAADERIDELTQERDRLHSYERDIREDRLAVQQGKTKAKRRIEIVGELKVVIDRILARKNSHKIRSSKLIVMDNGQPMTSSMLRGRFDAAREAAGVKKADFQMRDLRAKAGTDKAESSGDILQARDQLGHTTVVMTENYIRKRIGKKVTPTK